MSIWIRFIGLVMFYQVGAGAPYHAIVPKYQEGDEFCQTVIMPHAAFLRLPTDHNNILDASKWPKEKDCDGNQKCAVYRIPDGTTLTIDPGFPLDTSRSTDTLSCFLPNLASESLITNPKLHHDALTTLSATDFVLPAGQLFVHEFQNDNIFTALKVPVPDGFIPTQIRIIATPRSGMSAEAREIVVTPNTIIDVTDVPIDHIAMDYETKLMVPNEGNKGHFFFFRKLLDLPHPTEECRVFSDLSPGRCNGVRVKRQIRDHESISGNESTYNAGCGNITVGTFQPGFQ